MYPLRFIVPVVSLLVSNLDSTYVHERNVSVYERACKYTTESVLIVDFSQWKLF